MGRTIAWTEQAKKNVRSLDQQTALRVLRGLARFATGQEGDVKRLQGTIAPGFRLRVGDYRIRFCDHDQMIQVPAVKHRGEAYR